MTRVQTRFLLTEGKDDVYAIAGLMSNHVDWGHSREDWPVELKAAGSVDELLDPDYVSVSLKQAGLEVLGVVLDANDCYEARWQRLQAILRVHFDDIPGEPTPSGLILERDDGLRLGVWIMPDNRSRGMLETFLTYLVPVSHASLWEYAKTTAGTARDFGAPYKLAHRDKADIHTWLAWQDPPGRPLGEALKARCLDPDCPVAGPFVDWFVRLYQLQRLSPSTS
jgi:hypothetical protein